MKLILKNPLTLGVISLSDIPALAEGFGKLELKSFTAAMTETKSDAQIAQEAEDKAREKEVGGGGVGSTYARTPHTHTAAPRPTGEG